MCRLPQSWPREEPCEGRNGMNQCSLSLQPVPLRKIKPFSRTIPCPMMALHMLCTRQCLKIQDTLKMSYESQGLFWPILAYSYLNELIYRGNWLCDQVCLASGLYLALCMGMGEVGSHVRLMSRLFSQHSHRTTVGSAEGTGSE